MNKKVLLIISVLIFLYSLLFFFKLTEIGPEYDELAFVNAAIGCPNPSMFLHLSYHFYNKCLPVMIMPYLGATHAYILKFAFHLFGMNIFTLRTVNYLIGITSFILLYLSFKKWFKQGSALFITTLLMFDPQLFFTIRYDRTFVSPFLIRSIFIFLLSFYPSLKLFYLFYFLLGLLLGFMIYTKSDILFLFLSMMFGSIPLVFFYKKLVISFLKKLFKDKKRFIFSGLFLLIGFILGLFPLILYLKNSLSSLLLVGSAMTFTNDSYFQSIFNKLTFLVSQYSANQFFEAAFRQDNPFTITVFLSATIVIIYLFSFLKLWRKNWFFTWIISTITFFYLLVIFYPGFAAWGKFHHLFYIYPLPQIILTYFLFKGQPLRTSFKNKKGRVMILLFLISFLVTFILTYLSFQSLSSQTCGRISWSCSIKETLNFIDVKKPIVAGDWGLGTQMLFFTKGQIEVEELAFKANMSTPEQLFPYIRKLKDSCANFVLFTHQYTIFTNAEKAILPNLQNDSRYIKYTIYNRERLPFIEVYKCDPKLN